VAPEVELLGHASAREELEELSMPNPEGPTPERHYFELPPGIEKMTDAEIATFATELSKRILSVMPATVKKDVKGPKSGDCLQRVKADSTLTVRFLEEPTEWIQFFEYFDEGAGEKGMFLPQIEGVQFPAYQKPTMRYLVNALEVKKSKVIPLVLTKSTVDQIVRMYEKHSTILDRDYEITRSGTGFDTDYYVEERDPVQMMLSKYVKLDLIEHLETQLKLGHDEKGEKT
jgi:hypothetical protein